MRTLVTPIRSAWVDHPDGTSFTLNQRFERRTTKRPVFLSVSEHVDAIYDHKPSNEGVRDELILLRTDYSSGTGWFPADAYTLQDYKFWLVARSCDAERSHRDAKREDQFIKELRRMGRVPTD
jgi:hypothetical protein